MNIPLASSVSNPYREENVNTVEGSNRKTYREDLNFFFFFLYDNESNVTTDGQKLLLSPVFLHFAMEIQLRFHGCSNISSSIFPRLHP